MSNADAGDLKSPRASGDRAVSDPTKPQPPPKAPALRPVPVLWELVMRDLRYAYSGNDPAPLPEDVRHVLADMRNRDTFGRAKYGTPLQPWNGREALMDAYEEVLDGAVYLRQHLIEQDLVGGSLRDLYFSMLHWLVELRQQITKASLADRREVP